MRLLILFMIGLCNISHVFETDQCSDVTAYAYYHFESTRSYQAARYRFLEDES